MFIVSRNEYQYPQPFIYSTTGDPVENFSGRLVFKSSAPDRKPFPLNNGEVIIGRTAPADLVLDSSTVSRSHAKIACSDGVYFIEDLRSICLSDLFDGGAQCRP